MIAVVVSLDCMLSEKSAPEIGLLDEAQHFLQAAVHDLRAAQRRTGVAAQLLLQSPDDQERTELAGQMLQGLSQTEGLLNGISRYANALAPARYSITVFPCNSAVRFALANLDQEIRQTGATVTVGDLPELPGDRDRLAELFEHLIGNSLKFHASDPPVVEIDAHRVPEGWLFSVKDNGLGIPSRYRDRLFIAFRRLQGADFPGSGLGLAISRKIVDAHGGRIWIKEQSSPGVTFCFLLPAADGA
jgi:light-regulated signal transduction histidine kinase (bacteriophytochrome)